MTTQERIESIAFYILILMTLFIIVGIYIELDTGLPARVAIERWWGAETRP